MPRAWIVAFVALLVAGCSRPVEWGGEPKTDIPVRVVSLSPSTSEIISADGFNGQLAGRTESCNYPPYIEQQVPVFGSVKPDYEKLASTADISLIVYDPTLYSEADINKLKDLKKPLYAFHADSLADLKQKLKDFGQTLGCPLWMSSYIDSIDVALGNARAQKPQNPPKVAILSGSLIAGKKGFLADVVTQTGGQPVGPDVDRFVPLNAEQLIADNPDIVLLATDVSHQQDQAAQRALAHQVHDAFVTDPRFKSLAAVKNKQIYPIDADILLRQGSRVDKLVEAVGSIERNGASE